MDRERRENVHLWTLTAGCTGVGALKITALCCGNKGLQEAVTEMVSKRQWQAGFSALALHEKHLGKKGDS